MSYKRAIDLVRTRVEKDGWVCNTRSLKVYERPQSSQRRLFTFMLVIGVWPVSASSVKMRAAEEERLGGVLR